MRTWSELSAADIDSSRNDLSGIASYLQRKFGYAKDEVQIRLDEIVKRNGGKYRH